MAVLFGGLAIPAGLGAVACGEDFVPSAQVTSSTGEQIKSELPRDTGKYPYKIVVQVNPFDGLTNHTVAFYTQLEPVIDKSGNVPHISLPGTVYCPKDTDGPAIGCSEKNDKFIDGVELTLSQGGINVIKRYASRDSTKGLSESRESYRYKITVQIEIGKDPSRVSIYTNEEPAVENIGPISVVTVKNTFCPDGEEEGKQLGCGGSDKFVESITLIGGWGNTNITKQK